LYIQLYIKLCTTVYYLLVIEVSSKVIVFNFIWINIFYFYFYFIFLYFTFSFYFLNRLILYKIYTAMLDTEQSTRVSFEEVPAPSQSTIWSPSDLHALNSICRCLQFLLKSHSFFPPLHAALLLVQFRGLSGSSVPQSGVSNLFELRLEFIRELPEVHMHPWRSFWGLVW